MCYSHLGNGVRNGAIYITQWGFISGCYKVKVNGEKSGNGNEVCRSLGTMLFHLLADWCIVFVNRHWTPSFLYLLSLK